MDSPSRHLAPPTALSVTAGAALPVPEGTDDVLREIAACLPPAVPGLSARQWRRDGRLVIGRYIFDDEASAVAFAANLRCDSAVRALEALGLGAAAAAFERCPATSPIDRPVFVISAPRAGSTLLYDLLSLARGAWTVDGESHGVIEGIPSLHPAGRSFDSHRLTAEDADEAVVRTLHAGFAAEARASLGRRFTSLVEDRRPASIRLVEKTPENSLRVEFLAAAFPDARFVLLHRNSRQNVSSLVEAWGHPSFVKFPRLPDWDGPWSFLLPPDWRTLRGLSVSHVAAHQWYSANERALHDLDALPRDRWTVVEYSDLLASPGSVMAAVCEFAGLDPGPRLADALARPLPLTATTITPPSPLKWRTNKRFDPAVLARMGPLGGRLRHVSSPTTAARPAPPPEVAATMRYACRLADLDGPLPTEAAVVDRSVVVQIGSSPPLPVTRRARHRGRFLPDHPLVWVEDGRTGVLYPYWADRSDTGWLRRVRPGAPLPPDVPARGRAALVAAGVLLEPTAHQGAARHDPARQDDGDWKADAADYAEQAWCVLPGVLHPAHARALREYYRPAVEAGGWRLGDEQVERRHGWYNDPVARFFQWQFRGLVGRVVGQPVKPTYCYTSAYRGGAELKAHMDREQCEFTVSLLVDESSPSGPRWPLWLNGRDGNVSVVLHVGDAVVFAGCELPHWREPATDEHDQTMLLFHYVPVGFAGVLS